MNLPAALVFVGAWLFCNVGYVTAVLFLAAKRKLTAHRFALIFASYLSISFLGPFLLVVGLYTSTGFDIFLIVFFSGIALLHFIVGYPMGYFSYNHFLRDTMESFAQRLSKRSQTEPQDTDRKTG
ncbi:MAG: hypothetical protein JXJ17_00565 [Anaerolineae bacterium]|nr:hypothetical protein [Anaerolineae bacterium]